MSTVTVDQQLSTLAFGVTNVTRLVTELSTSVNERLSTLETRLSSLETSLSTLTTSSKVESSKASPKKRGTNPLVSLEGATKVKKAASTVPNINNWSRGYIIQQELMPTLESVSPSVWSDTMSKMAGSKHTVNSAEYNKILVGKFFTTLKLRVEATNSVATPEEVTFFNTIKAAHTTFKNAELERVKTEAASSESQVDSSNVPSTETSASAVASALAGLN
jgi:hypothetical protein